MHWRADRFIRFPYLISTGKLVVVSDSDAKRGSRSARRRTHLASALENSVLRLQRNSPRDEQNGALSIHLDPLSVCWRFASVREVLLPAPYWSTWSINFLFCIIFINFYIVFYYFFVVLFCVSHCTLLSFSIRFYEFLFQPLVESVARLFYTLWLSSLPETPRLDANTTIAIVWVKTGTHTTGKVAFYRLAGWLPSASWSSGWYNYFHC